MNYEYKTIDKNIIVSKIEHKQITEQYKNGKSIIYLRDGNLMINMAFVGSIKETDELTNMEIKTKDEYLRLPPEKRSQATFTERKDNPIIENTNWKKIGDDKDWKNCAECGVSHFIPDDKIICLGCVGKNILVKK